MFDNLLMGTRAGIHQPLLQVSHLAYFFVKKSIENKNSVVTLSRVLKGSEVDFLVKGVIL